MTSAMELERRNYPKEDFLVCASCGAYPHTEKLCPVTGKEWRPCEEVLYYRWNLDKGENSEYPTFLIYARKGKK